MATSGKPLSTQEREQIKRLSRRGVSIRTIATQLACSPTTVCKVKKTFSTDVNSASKVEHFAVIVAVRAVEDKPMMIAEPPTFEALLTPSEVARLLRVKPDAISRLVRDGSLPEPVRINRRVIRFRAGEIQAVIEKNQRPASVEPAPGTNL